MAYDNVTALVKGFTIGLGCPDYFLPTRSTKWSDGVVHAKHHKDFKYRKFTSEDIVLKGDEMPNKGRYIAMYGPIYRLYYVLYRKSE